MSYNPELTARVRQLLTDDSKFEEIKMFGSIGFKVDGKLMVGVGNHPDHVMMVRVGPEAYARALEQEGAAPAVMRGREMKGYIFLTEEAIKTDKDLYHWIKLALEYNKQLTSK